MHLDHERLVSKMLVTLPSAVHHIHRVSVQQDNVTPCCDNLVLTYRNRAHFLCPSCVEKDHNSQYKELRDQIYPKVFCCIHILPLIDFLNKGVRR